MYHYSESTIPISDLVGNTDVITKSYNQCPYIHVRDSTNINYMNFRPDLSLNPNCAPNSNFRAEQKNGIDGNCLVGALATNIAKLLSEKKSNIRDKFMAQCAHKDPTHVASIIDTVIPICNARIIQGATDMTSCMINSMQNFAIDEKKMRTAPISASPLLFGLFIFSIIIILFVIIIKYF